jgi:hypothetical protein
VGEPEDAGMDPKNPTLTFACACGRGHGGRPDSAVFIGCGAAWNQRMTANSDKDTQASPATPAEAEWAAHIRQDLSGPPLARIRATANQWRNGVTALTTVLTSVALLGGTVNNPHLHPGTRWLVLASSILGFVALLFGTLIALSASIGASGYDHKLLATHALRRYERKRGRTAIREISQTKWCVLVGVGLIAAAGFIAFANPAP